MSSTNLKNGINQGEGELLVPKARQNVFFLQEKNLSLLVHERDVILTTEKSTDVLKVYEKQLI